jgi:hypothetical protein
MKPKRLGALKNLIVPVGMGPDLMKADNAMRRITGYRGWWPQTRKSW